jgi:hypothetical protein
MEYRETCKYCNGSGYTDGRYLQGDLAQYTGKVITLHGVKWAELRMVEGHEKGKIKHIRVND